MKKIYFLSIVIISSLALASCRKSPDYVAEPYFCDCGKFKWQNVEYDLLGVNYILSDSTEFESRRYYITADVALEGEAQTHGLSAWIEIPDLDGGGQFVINPTGDQEFVALVDEFNLNDPIDTLRQYVPVNAVVQVSQAPLSGGDEKVQFQMTLNQMVDGVLIPGDINCSGTFTVYINQ
jgi:hypothetical protein